MNFLLIVTVDTNDADYNTEVSRIEQEQLDKLLPVFEAIKNFKPYKGMTDPKRTGTPAREWTHNNNWPVGEYAYRPDLGGKTPEEIYAGVLTEDQIGLFEDYLPSAGDTGYHDIVSITVLEVANETQYVKGKYYGRSF